MKVNSPQVITDGFKTVVTPSDPRITQLGKWLRCGLDEVPQLWCIVRGEMEWVGPRPDEDWMLPNYGPVSIRRLSGFPGITGLAQVLNSRNLSTAEGYAIDLWYLAHRSLSLDSWIVLVTPLFMTGWRSIGVDRLRRLRAIPEFEEFRKLCEAELGVSEEDSDAREAATVTLAAGVEGS